MELPRALMWISIVVLFTNPGVAHGNADDDDDDADVDNELKLILVIFDGFRHDYLKKAATPNFDRLVQNGAKPARVIPSFVTKTFPGHHTIATGLYQESHGIIGNSMYDPEFDSTFNQGTAEPRWWNYGGEPIWVTNQKAGGRSVSVFYPGARVNISGQTATYYQPSYDESMPFEDRIDLVVGLLNNGSVNLGLLYFHEPDSTGHLQGPDSQALADAIAMCDDTLGILLDRLTEVGLADEINVIVTSDHGMANVYEEQTIFLDDYIDSDMYFYTSNDPVFGLWPYDEGDTADLYNALKDVNPNMTVFLKDDIPEDFHYRDNRRVGPILIAMEEGWHVWTNRSVPGNWQRYKGTHGFMPNISSMQTFFVASGPAFKINYASPNSFNTVDIYNLMCHVLGLSPAPNNGTFNHVDWLLAPEVTPTSAVESTTSSCRHESGSLVGLFVGLMSLIGYKKLTF